MRIVNKKYFKRRWKLRLELLKIFCLFATLGFGEVFGNVWLGLENIHQLTKGGNVTLRIDLKRSDGEVGHALYTNFSITDEADAYRLNYGSYSGTVGSDSLLMSKNQKFSTADRDNDEASINCAQRFKGGWWHKACFEANLNNDYYKGLDGEARSYARKNDMEAMENVLRRYHIFRDEIKKREHRQMIHLSTVR